MGQSHLLIVVLGHDCAGGPRSDLVLKVQHVPRVSIVEDRGPTESVLFRFSTSSVEQPSFDLGNKHVSVCHASNIWGSLEQGSLGLRVLLDGGGSISNSNLFSKLTGGTLGLLSDGGPAESKSQLVKESTKPKLLDMGKAKVPQHDMPLHPNLLVGNEVLVGRMQHRSHGLESGLGFALAKQSDPGKETGIITKTGNIEIDAQGAHLIR